MKKRMIIMLILVGVVLGGVFGFGAFKAMMIKRYFSTRTAPPQTVSAIPAKAEPWQSKIEAIGTLVALNGTDVSPELAGVVSRILFKSGEEVQAGTLLVELNTAADRAQLESLKAMHALAEKTYGRDKLLIESRTISQEEFDTARANMESTAAQVAAQGALIDKKLIRAPFTGRLGIRAVDLGQYVNPGTKLVNLQQLDPIFVDFFLAQKAVHDVQTGQRVTVRADALRNQAFTGRFAALDSAVDIGTRNVKVRSEIANPKHLLLPGMFVTADIDVGIPTEYITLPQTAISYNPYGNIVYLVSQDGETADKKPKLVAKQKFIVTGDTRGDQIAVLEGLQPGDMVVTAGQVKLRNDTPVVIDNTIQPADNPTPKPKDY
jgi:membrane fusion protein (multidrug efflux system)